MKNLKIKVAKRNGNTCEPYLNSSSKPSSKKQRIDKELLNNITTIRNVIVNKKPTKQSSDVGQRIYKRPKSNRQTRFPSMAQCIMLNILPKDMEKMLSSNKGRRKLAQSIRESRKTSVLFNNTIIHEDKNNAKFKNIDPISTPVSPVAIKNFSFNIESK